jgi:hypothetical protein
MQSTLNKSFRNDARTSQRNEVIKNYAIETPPGIELENFFRDPLDYQQAAPDKKWRGVMCGHANSSFIYALIFAKLDPTAPPPQSSCPVRMAVDVQGVAPHYGEQHRAEVHYQAFGSGQTPAYGYPAGGAGYHASPHPHTSASTTNQQQYYAAHPPGGGHPGGPGAANVMPAPPFAAPAPPPGQQYAPQEPATRPPAPAAARGAASPPSSTSTTHRRRAPDSGFEPRGADGVVRPRRGGDQNDHPLDMTVVPPDG